MQKIYVIGHKSPDLDSIAAAIAYARLKNILEKTDIYAPAAAGEPNRETVYVLDKYGFKKPEIIKDGRGKTLILIDHNEVSQAVDGLSGAKIAGVVDHHKIDFKYSEPIPFLVKPWGSSCSIVAQMYFDNNVVIDKQLAGLMLAAILVDTIITKSPTYTENDGKIIEKLSEIAAVPDWKEFGLEIFKVRSSIKDLSALEIIKSDFKDFEFKRGKFGIGQVETVDLGEFSSKEDEIMEGLESLRAKENYHSVILFITDILKGGSKFLVSTSEPDKMAKALGAPLESNRVYIEGVVSRKKQVVPRFAEVFDK